jgi:hypothetical protein
VSWGFQFAFDERLADDHLGSNVCQFTPLPGFHLLLHRLKVSLLPINTHFICRAYESHQA